MTLTATPALESILEPALLRSILAIQPFETPQPPFDAEDGESPYCMRITVTKHFKPEELDGILEHEGRVLALTHWALYCLLSKPYIVQYHSPNVRWRWVTLPELQIDRTKDGRIGLTWGWDIQFVAPSDSPNVYLRSLDKPL
ncbi:MAG TPA: hypothetical protein VEI97_08705, partial [bacterium]|nr:hypothetical protein [bacterium]